MFFCIFITLCNCLDIHFDGYGFTFEFYSDYLWLSWRMFYGFFGKTDFPDHPSFLFFPFLI